jgi:glycosyltransferase involved in cell wall biosynthesis
MRIGLISTLSTPVRREGSASVEGLVWLLSRELTRLGHKVTVFATADSEPVGELVAALPGPYGKTGSPGEWRLCEWINLCRAVEESDRFDVLHSHSYLHGLPLQRLARAPLIHTLHVTPYQDEALLRSMFPEAPVTAISASQWSAFPECIPTAVIHHGVGPEEFPLCLTPDDHVCYLGRFTASKGPLQAIQAARACGLRLILAGPEDDYFREHLARFVDGDRVKYAGYVLGKERARLLGQARALLYPLQAPEPFGLVQVEAMMCGTPVVAMRLGAVPEIVEDGLTGYSAGAEEEYRSLVLRSFDLDRRRVRARAVQRFTAERMAQQYLQVYEEVVSRVKGLTRLAGAERNGGWRP